MPLVSVWPGNRDADSHFRKEAENVPVFRGLFNDEIEFGSQIAGIVDTSGTIYARCDFWESRRFRGPASLNRGMKFDGRRE